LLSALAEREPGLASHTAPLVDDRGVAPIGKGQAVLALSMRRRRARQPCRCRTRGGFELVVDAVDEERANEVVGGEVGRGETDDKERDGDQENACAEGQRLSLGSRRL
jgi:hypothetical protein